MKINKKKLRDELLCIAAIVVGIVLVVINFKYAMPGTSGDINKVLAFCISIAWTPGIAFIIGGIVMFLGVRDTKYPQNKAR